MGCFPSKNKSENSLSLFSTDEKSKPPIKYSPKRGYQSNLDDYITVSLLGVGKSCEVLLSFHDPTGEYRALKIIKKSQKTIQLTSEILILEKLDHPNILKCFEMLEDSHAFYISSFYCKGGNFSTKLKQVKAFGESELAIILNQILSAVSHCHDKKIIHRDLKLENILIEKNEGLDLKIADFGFAFFANDRLPSEVCGTPSYMAPEIGQGEYNEKVDLWSVGVIFFVLATGKFPFRCKKNENGTRAEYKELSFDEFDRFERSFEIVELLKAFLTVNPNNRISAKDALQSPWLKKNNLSGLSFC